LLQSLDRPSLADAVQASGAAQARVVDALLQVNPAAEATKGGYAMADVDAEAARLRSFDHLRLRGVMVMAPLDAPEGELRRVFQAARDARQRLRAAGHTQATELSMGMSGDYEMAVEEGATCVRLGTVLFGARPA